MEKKIRVLFDANPLVRQKTGVGFYTEGMVKALARIPEVELVGHYFAPHGPLPELPKAGNLGYTSNSWLVGMLVKALRKIHVRLPWELLSRRRGDILFFPDFTAWPSLFGAPKLLTIHDLTFVDHPEYVTKRNLKFLRRYVKNDARKAALVLTVSQFTKRRLQEVFNLEPDKIIVEPVPPPEPIRSKSSIDLPADYILFLGTIEPRKNIKGLVEAYALLPDELTEKYSLLIVGGQGWDSGKLNSRIAELRASGLDILTPGYVNDATRAALYARASMVVIPSFYEGFSMPISEAFSYGAPVAASDIPVFKEVAGAGVIYFDPYSSDSIKNALRKSLSDKQFRQSLAAKGADRLKDYDWQTLAQTIYNHMERLVK